MAQSYRLLVVSHFSGFVPGDRITGKAEMARVIETHPEYVLREPVTAETQPSKAEVRAAGLPDEAQAREAVGLPAGPVEAADAKPGKTSKVTLQG